MRCGRAPVARVPAPGGPGAIRDRGPWLSEGSPRLRSTGTFLIHLRDAGEECPRPFAPQAASSTPPHRHGSPVAGSAIRRSEGTMRPAIARRHSPGTSLMALAAGRVGGGAAEGRGVRAELSGREVKRRLAGASQVERRSERPPSEDAEAGHGAPYRVTRQPARRKDGRVLRNVSVLRGSSRSLSGDSPRGDIPRSSYTLRSVPPQAFRSVPALPVRRWGTSTRPW